MERLDLNALGINEMTEMEKKTTEGGFLLPLINIGAGLLLGAILTSQNLY